MTNRMEIRVPLNRVEGDLEIRAELDGGVVTNAWCSGTMYRGFEKILVGRGAMDGLVLTPRVCGICSTGHLIAAARALDDLAAAPPPPNAVRVRNLALMAETIQSDVRHAFLMFAVDFVNPAYRERSWYAEAMRRWEPFRGRTIAESLRETKRALEIVAILGGQWPHSSFAIPGGVVSAPSGAELTQCRHLLAGYQAWYEKRVLGCSAERWLEVRNSNDLDRWLGESEDHRRSELGFLFEVARETGIDRYGAGVDNFVSFGAHPLPEGTRVRGPAGSSHLVPAGFVQGTRVSDFDQKKVAEQVAHSWYEDYDGGRHPFDGETKPYASGGEGKKYSWAKAPRYDGSPAETSPLAEMLAAGNPLFTHLVAARGASAFVRELARLVRPAQLFSVMQTWIDETTDGAAYVPPKEPIENGQGVGLTHATRGALGHWVRVRDGRIDHYQIITPTAWNASPRDGRGLRGPMEEALVGVAVADPENPVELGHVVRSFDACLVCTVHAVTRGGKGGRTVRFRS